MDILLMAINSYSIGGYWLLFYKQLLVVMLLMTMSGYFIDDY